MGRKNRVTVATSDGLEQLIIRGQGCMLLSAEDLKEDVERAAGWWRRNGRSFLEKGRIIFYPMRIRIPDLIWRRCVWGQKKARKREKKKRPEVHQKDQAGRTERNAEFCFLLRQRMFTPYC